MNGKKNINIKIDDPQIVPFILGVNNNTLNLIESIIGVELDSTGDIITVSGSRDSCLKAKVAIEELYTRIKEAKNFNIENIDSSLSAIIRNSLEKNMKISNSSENYEIIKTWKKYIIAKTIGHNEYIKALRNYDLIFCVGPAGSGKTYLAVASAINALKERQVERIVLSRPAVEAGEKLGFLPGDMKEKVDPYLRPIYDALYDMLPSDRVEKKIMNGEIEIAPLAFMRGRTLSNAFVLIDEAQNTTSIQMKMLLTRLGEGSKMVITGDLSQIDIGIKKDSGLLEALKLLKNIKEINITKLNNIDIVRHPIVCKIVKAYDKEN